MAPSVSVALATFNGARFLAEQLESILTQDPAPLEVVVADDGSTDDSLEVVRAAAAAHPGVDVRILPPAGHLGVRGTFERAIAATRGDLVALSDQDDRWHPDRLARGIARFEADPALLLLHGDADLIDGEGAALGGTLFGFLPVTAAERAQLASGRAFEAYLRRNLATGATVMFRRDLLAAALPIAEGWIHDEWFAIVAAATGEVGVETASLIDYRQHGGNEIGVRRATLGYRLGRLVEPRGTRYADFAARWTRLADRLEAVGAPADRVTEARARAAFDARRAASPAFRPARLGGILRALRSGEYARYSSQGRLDAVRDLLQPA